jgi:hypothetical protein
MVDGWLHRPPTISCEHDVGELGLAVTSSPSFIISDGPGKTSFTNIISLSTPSGAPLRHVRSKTNFTCAACVKAASSKKTKNNFCTSPISSQVVASYGRQVWQEDIETVVISQLFILKVPVILAKLHVELLCVVSSCWDPFNFAIQGLDPKTACWVRRSSWYILADYHQRCRYRRLPLGTEATSKHRRAVASGPGD